MWIDNKKRKREYEAKCDGCTFAKEMCRCWWWWWYTRGVENNACSLSMSIDSIDFSDQKISWWSVLAELCMLRACVCIILPFLYMPLNWTACANATAVNLFLSPFFPTFFFIFQFMIHELSERNSMDEKKIDHKFSFCTIFFPRFTQKKSTIFSISLFDDWKNPSSMCTEKSWSCMPAQPKGMETY